MSLVQRRLPKQRHLEKNLKVLHFLLVSQGKHFTHVLCHWGFLFMSHVLPYPTSSKASSGKCYSCSYGSCPAAVPDGPPIEMEMVPAEPYDPRKHEPPILMSSFWDYPGRYAKPNKPWCIACLFIRGKLPSMMVEQDVMCGMEYAIFHC